MNRVAITKIFSFLPSFFRPKPRQEIMCMKFTSFLLFWIRVREKIVLRCSVDRNWNLTKGFFFSHSISNMIDRSGEAPVTVYKTCWYSWWLVRWCALPTIPQLARRVVAKLVESSNFCLFIVFSNLHAKENESVCWVRLGIHQSVSLTVVVVVVVAASFKVKFEAFFPSFSIALQVYELKKKTLISNLMNWYCAELTTPLSTWLALHWCLSRRDNYVLTSLARIGNVQRARRISPPDNGPG